MGIFASGSKPKFRMIYSVIWSDKRIRTLSHTELVVAFYVLTGPESNRAGYYLLSPARGAEDCQMTTNYFLATLADVCNKMSWAWDEENRVICIRSWWKWNNPDSDKTIIGYFKDVLEVPYSPLLSVFVENAKLYLDPTHVEVCANRFPSLFDTYGRGMPYPLDTYGKGMPYTETETDTETDTETKDIGALKLETSLELLPTPSRGIVPAKKPKKRGTKDVSHELEEEFEAMFWPNVPNKLGHGLAKEAFAKARKGASLAEIMAGLPNYLAYEESRRTQQDYRPLHPSTWLNQERWRDGPLKLRKEDWKGEAMALANRMINGEEEDHDGN
jgi:hypothetical protein